MTKLLNKILDSKVAKKVMIPVGNKIINTAKKGVNYLEKQRQIEKKFENHSGEEMRELERKERSGLVSRKGRNTSDGYMRG